MRRNLVDFPSDDDTGSDRDYSMGQKAYDAVAAVWVTAVGTDGGEHSSRAAAAPAVLDAGTEAALGVDEAALVAAAFVGGAALMYRLILLDGIPRDNDAGRPMLSIVQDAVENTVRSIPPKGRREVETVREAVRRRGWASKPSSRRAHSMAMACAICRAGWWGAHWTPKSPTQCGSETNC